MSAADSGIKPSWGHSNWGTEFGDKAGDLTRAGGQSPFTEFTVPKNSGDVGNWGPRRIVIDNNDGNVFYTPDHYHSWIAN